MENFDAYKVAGNIMEEMQKEYKELKTLNVMVLGKTGVGKSTLINNMFNQKIAETGIGKPITQKIRKITKPGFPLAIYDTPGLELGGENAINTLLEEIIGEIKKGARSNDVSEAIHCIWYCISTPTHRFEQSEIDFLRVFLGKTSEYGVNVIIVLTQSYSKKEADTLKKEIEKENLPIVKVVPVLAEDYAIDDEYIAKAYGLDTLTEVMNEAIPDTVKKTFVTVQKANLKLKQKKAQAVVAASVAAAAATGAAPIPFSDAPLLITTQTTMLGGITAVFGLPIEKSTVTAIVSTLAGTAGTTVLGKTIAANLLKFVPGAGTVVGGAISASTAGVLTAALGEAYIIIMTMIYKGELSVEDLSTDKGKKEITKIFTEQLKMAKKQEQ